MTHLYLDASAAGRVVLSQPGSRAPVQGRRPIVSSRIVEVEMHRAIDRLRILGQLTIAEAAAKVQELVAFLERIHLVPVSDEVVARARARFPVAVRSLDAIHVASAQVLAIAVGPLEFWTHDIRQAEAALAHGLNVKGL